MSGSPAFDAKYILEKVEIGSGATATVMVCRSKVDGSEYAVKIMQKSGNILNMDAIRNEIAIMKVLSHQYIIRLVDNFETPESILLVLEIADGGDLFDRILDTVVFEEAAAQRMVRQIVEAMAYMHSRGVAHRDLKPENILFVNDSAKSDLKIIDFGFAKRFVGSPGPSSPKEVVLPDAHQDKLAAPDAAAANILVTPPPKVGKAKHGRMGTMLGTEGYAAPEVFGGQEYCEKCDVWSIGIITHILLTGVPPFVDVDPEIKRPFWTYVNEMDAKSTDRKVDFSLDGWKGKSPGARAFVKRALMGDVSERASAAELLRDPWLESAAVATRKRESKSAATATVRAPAQLGGLLGTGGRRASLVGAAAAGWLTLPVKSPQKAFDPGSAYRNHRTASLEATPICRGRKMSDTGAETFQSSDDEDVTLSFDEKYELKNLEIGSGVTSVCMLCRLKSAARRAASVKKENNSFAVKIIDREAVLETNPQIDQHFKIMSTLSHPAVVHLNELFWGADKIFQVMDMCWGGDLQDSLLQHRAFGEAYVREVMKTVLSGLAYLHARGIAHGSLRLSKILRVEDKDSSPVKLALFKTESARKPIDPDDDDAMAFVAPEVARSATSADSKSDPSSKERGLAPDLIATKQGDAWSCGVILHLLLCGVPPFVDLDDEELEISQNQPFWLLFPQMCVHKPAKSAWTESKEPAAPLCRLSFPDIIWKDVSAGAKSLVSGLLDFDPTQRLSAAAALQHPWITGEAKEKSSATAQTRYPSASPPPPAALTSQQSNPSVSESSDTLSLPDKDLSLKRSSSTPLPTAPKNNPPAASEPKLLIRMVGPDGKQHKRMASKSMDNMRRSASDKNLKARPGRMPIFKYRLIRKRSLLRRRRRSKVSALNAGFWGTLTFKQKGGSYKDAMSKDLSKKLSSRDRLSPGRNEAPADGTRPRRSARAKTRRSKSKASGGAADAQDDVADIKRSRSAGVSGSSPRRAKTKGAGSDSKMSGAAGAFLSPRVQRWTVPQVAAWVGSLGASKKWSKYAILCVKHEIDGATLQSVKRKALLRLGFSELHADTLLSALARVMRADGATRSQTLQDLSNRTSGATILTSILLKKQKLGWAKRMFRLTSEKLFYYHLKGWFKSSIFSRQTQLVYPKPAAVFPVSSITQVEEDESSPYMFRIRIGKHSRKELLLRAANLDDCCDWVRLLNITRSRCRDAEQEASAEAKSAIVSQ